jgi:hypothetical protein
MLKINIEITSESREQLKDQINALMSSLNGGVSGEYPIQEPMQEPTQVPSAVKEDKEVTCPPKSKNELRGKAVAAVKKPNGKEFISKLAEEYGAEKLIEIPEEKYGEVYKRIDEWMSSQ